MTKLGILDEILFQKWYRDYSRKLKLSQNPDDPEHFYDYRGAYLSGAEPDKYGHLPSIFKLKGHPREFINGVDTKTGLSTGIRDMLLPFPLKRNENDLLSQ